ncbi:MAG: hypothetical protein RL670_1236 [Actinomycetota bacterium]
MLRRVVAAVAIVTPFAIGWIVVAPATTLGLPVVAQRVAVNARDLQLVCPGALFRSAADTGAKVGSFSQTGIASLSGTFDAQSGGALTARDITGTVVGSQASGTVTDPLTLTASGVGLTQGSKLLNAGQLQLVNDPRAAGLFAAPCLLAEGEHWLLGATTTTGRESLLILNNPGAVNATVAIELFGSTGKIVTAGQEGISVPAHGTTVIPVASLAPDLDSIAVHVLASSSVVTAAIQQKTVRGLVAAGGDLIAPSTELAKNLVIPGLFVRGTKDAAKLASKSADYADLQPVLQLFLPASAKSAANVSAQVVGVTAKTFGTVVRQTLNPGTVVNVPLTGLDDGDYSVFISADQALRAAVRLSRTNLAQHPITDFTWLQSAQVITDQPMALTAPASGISKLSIANQGSAIANVTLTINGKTQTVAVPAQNSKVIAIAAHASALISSDQPVAATLIVDVNYTVANLPVLDYQNLGASLAVLVR